MKHAYLITNTAYKMLNFAKYNLPSFNTRGVLKKSTN